MATSPNRLAGTASVTIDGKSFMIVGQGTYRPSSVTRAALKGQSGVHGYSEMATEGQIRWQGRDGSDQLIADLNAITNGTIVFQAANGKTIIGRNMWRDGDPIEVNTEDGTYEATFSSTDVTEN